MAAVAPDWPGLERGAKTPEAAIERLRAYIPRYGPVAKLAGLGAEFDRIYDFDIVERYPGTGSTDFWGISFTFSSIDTQAMSGDILERELALMQACWVFFDEEQGDGFTRPPREASGCQEHLVTHLDR